MPDCDKPQTQDAATQKAITLTFQFLKERGVDQNRVAECLGVRHTLISLVKNGKRPASIRQVEVLSELARNAMQAEPLGGEEFVLAEKVTVAWWDAIMTQIHAVEALRQHVSQQLITLQDEADLTPEDLTRLAAYAADAQQFSQGLRRLVELGQAWQVVATRLVQTWERIKAEKYLDGAPRQSQKGLRRPARHQRRPRARV
jgi:hypothetical protein